MSSSPDVISRSSDIADPLEEAARANPPGNSAIRYRYGVHRSLLRGMAANLPRFAIPSEDGSTRNPLAALTNRNASDPSLALLDASASMLDVLSFYQERILNESYLGTATERRSLIELGRTIGREPRPVTAAGTHLAFTVDDSPGATGRVSIPANARVMSVPGQGEQPQIFETDTALDARAEWNQLAPERLETQRLEVGATTLDVAGLEMKFRPGEWLLFRKPAEPEKGGESLGAKDTFEIRVIEHVESLPKEDRTRLAWQLGLSIRHAEPEVHVLRQRAALFGHNAPDQRMIKKALAEQKPEPPPLVLVTVTDGKREVRELSPDDVKVLFAIRAQLGVDEQRRFDTWFKDAFGQKVEEYAQQQAHGTKDAPSEEPGAESETAAKGDEEPAKGEDGDEAPPEPTADPGPDPAHSRQADDDGGSTDDKKPSSCGGKWCDCENDDHVLCTHRDKVQEFLKYFGWASEYFLEGKLPERVQRIYDLYLEYRDLHDNPDAHDITEVWDWIQRAMAEAQKKPGDKSVRSAEGDAVEEADGSGGEGGRGGGDDTVLGPAPNDPGLPAAREEEWPMAISGHSIDLDGEYATLLPGTLLVIHWGTGYIVRRADEVMPGSRTDFGLSCKITRLQLDTKHLPVDLPANAVRAAAVLAQSERIELAGSPIPRLDGLSVELDQPTWGLEPGRLLVVRGKRPRVRIRKEGLLLFQPGSQEVQALPEGEELYLLEREQPWVLPVPDALPKASADEPEAGPKAPASREEVLEAFQKGDLAAVLQYAASLGDWPDPDPAAPACDWPYPDPPPENRPRIHFDPKTSIQDRVVAWALQNDEDRGPIVQICTDWVWDKIAFRISCAEEKIEKHYRHHRVDVLLESEQHDPSPPPEADNPEWGPFWWLYDALWRKEAEVPAPATPDVLAARGFGQNAILALRLGESRTDGTVPQRWHVEDRQGRRGYIRAWADEIGPLPAGPKDPDVSELVTLERAEEHPGSTTLEFTAALAAIFDRSTVSLLANVVTASHGESVREVLGSGDASRTHQRFTLRRSPVTRVYDPARGLASSLRIWVDGVEWIETPSLYSALPDARCFVTIEDEDGRATVVFGDGVRGARLPTGQENVVATYRAGGGPVGRVGAGRLTLLQTRPQGLRSVTNPLPATGGMGPETADEARAVVQASVATLGRIVSLRDYEDFVQALPGVGRASVTSLVVDRVRKVHLTIADANWEPLVPISDLAESIRLAIGLVSLPDAPVVLDGYEKLPFNVTARIRVRPDFAADEVLERAEAALRQAFSAQVRTFGQDVTAAEVIASLQAVTGVEAVILGRLYLGRRTIDAPGNGDPVPILEARSARVEDGVIRKAQVLVLSPEPQDLGEVGGLS